MKQYRITKILNNNVIICTQNDRELVLIGKRIGFNKKPGAPFNDGDLIEKTYVLEQKAQQDHYKALVAQTDDTVIQAIIEAVDIIANATFKIHNPNLVVALTDHITFAYQRLKRSQLITNPFIVETKQLYHEAYHIAEKVIEQLNRKLDVTFPEDEIGFIALHIASNLESFTIYEMKQINRLIQQSRVMIEKSLNITIETESLHYQRFIRHIQFLIRRLNQGEKIHTSQDFETTIKSHYPICYDIASKVTLMLQQALNIPIYRAEVVHLTLHIYHFLDAPRELKYECH